MTPDQRRIQELTEKLARVEQERDSFQSQAGQLRRFMDKVLIEAAIVQNQLKYFNDARKEVDGAKGFDSTI